MLITGPENAGKTSLLKTLMKGYSSSGLYTLFLDMRQTGPMRQERLWELLRSGFERQYESGSLERVVTSRKENKICLIDNISANFFENGVMSKLFENFGHILLFSESPLAGDLLASLPDEGTTIGSFELPELNPELREDLCRKWHSIKSTANDIKEIEYRIKTSLKAIEDALSHGLAPSYPIIVITILNRASSDEEYSPQDSTYASYIEHIILKPLREGPYSEEIENLKLHLSKIGYEMFTSGRSELSGVEIGALLGEKGEETTAALSSSGLLVRTGRGLAFKYELSYSYFTASYIARNLDKEQIRQNVRELCRDFRDEGSAGIMLFLTYLSDDTLIEDEITGALRTSRETAAPESIKERLDELDELIESIVGTGQKDKKLKEIRAEYSSTKDITPGAIITTSYAREYKSPDQKVLLIKQIEQIRSDLALLRTSGHALRKKLLHEKQNPGTSELTDAIFNFWLRSLSSALEHIPLSKINPPADQNVYGSTNSPDEEQLEKISEYNLAIHILTLYMKRLSEIFGEQDPADIISRHNLKLPKGSQELIDKCLELLGKQNNLPGAKK